MSIHRQRKRLEELRSRFDEIRFRPSARRGQNFLLDANQANLVARLGDPRPGDVILEVGPGSGFLTRVLAASGATIVGVELDERLFELVGRETAGFPNVHLMRADILDGKNAVNPAVLERLEQILAEQAKANPSRPPALKCVSNLPYSAGTPFAMNLLSSPLPWTRGVFLLQWEVAARMTAAPGSEAYGALSIGCTLAARTRIERKVPPTVFWPRPSVASATVVMDFRPAAERMALPWRGLRRTTSAVFSARRKNLRNALKGLWEKEEIDPLLERLGFSAERRGETLSPEEFVEAARAWERRSHSAGS